jgi:hypothetical protein
VIEHLLAQGAVEALDERVGTSCRLHSMRADRRNASA